MIRKIAKTATYASILLLCSSMASASSHSEAAFIKANPKVDATDFYMFRSYEAGRQDYVTLIANYYPLQDPQGGPNYFAMDPNAVYEIHVDNDGDNIEDITFQFKFTNTLGAGGSGAALDIGGQTVTVPLKNIGGISAGDNSALNFHESYQIWKIDGDRRSGTRTQLTDTGLNATLTKPYDYVGDKTFTSTTDYKAYADQYIHGLTIPGCTDGKVFVGQRKEPFAVNLGETFDLVNYVPVEGDSAPGANDGQGFPGGITQDAANNDLRGKNITSIALEIPTSCLTGSGDVIGAWTTASLPQARLLNPTATFDSPAVYGGAYTQVSRLSNPLVNELVIGINDKNGFNASEPKDDGQWATYVTHPTLPALLNVLFKDAVNTTLGASIADLAPTNFPRTDLVAAFLTGLSGVNDNGGVSEMLRLNTSIAPTAAGSQNTVGVAAGDNAGFPNGRRPGDDVVDIALRVVMGALCHLSLGLCDAADAAVGNVAFTDGAPISDADFDGAFPYLKAPNAGSPN